MDRRVTKKAWPGCPILGMDDAGVFAAIPYQQLPNGESPTSRFSWEEIDRFRAALPDRAGTASGNHGASEEPTGVVPEV